MNGLAMTHFLLPDTIEFKDAISFVSLVSKIRTLPPKQKPIVGLRLGLAPGAWEETTAPENVFWARSIAKASKGELFAARCKCGPFYQICPTSLCNPPEGFLAEATIRYGSIKVCPQLFSCDSIEARSADWKLWLRPDFCRALLERNPGKSEVDRVCLKIVEVALGEGRTYIKREFVAAVLTVIPDAAAIWIQAFWRVNTGPWKAGPGRPRNTA